jgi:hypothetical protein
MLQWKRQRSSNGSHGRNLLEDNSSNRGSQTSSSIASNRFHKHPVTDNKQNSVLTRTKQEPQAQDAASTSSLPFFDTKTHIKRAKHGTCEHSTTSTISTKRLPSHPSFSNISLIDDELPVDADPVKEGSASSLIIKGSWVPSRNNDRWLLLERGMSLSDFFKMQVNDAISINSIKSGTSSVCSTIQSESDEDGHDSLSVLFRPYVAGSGGSSGLSMSAVFMEFDDFRYCSTAEGSSSVLMDAGQSMVLREDRDAVSATVVLATKMPWYQQMRRASEVIE